MIMVRTRQAVSAPFFADLKPSPVKQFPTNRKKPEKIRGKMLRCTGNMWYNDRMPGFYVSGLEPGARYPV